MLGNQSSTTALLYLYVLCGANYLLFQWVHEAFCMCCPLNKWCWAHNIGFPMPSMAKKMTPANGSPTQKHCPTLAPAFLHTNFGLPYLEPFILLTRFLALLLSKLCAFFPPQETGVRESVKKKKTPPSLCETHLAHQCPSLPLLVVTQP